jgi:hypothetical protein
MTSKTYRAMIYFAVATFHMYSKDTISTEKTDISMFRRTNPELVKRIFDECLSIMEYELSFHQMDAAIQVYLIGLHKPQSVHDTEVYKLKSQT